MELDTIKGIYYVHLLIALVAFANIVGELRHLQILQ